jgi:DNA-binding Lrp family transcriptional regulator
MVYTYRKGKGIMDEKDREIIQLLQNKFPLVPEPYKEIGDKLWMDEVSVISRLVKMFQDGSIRHFGPFFNGSALGYSGCLAAMQVPTADLDRVTSIINKFDGITHNYLRDGEPNLWFTVLAPTADKRDEIIQSIKKDSGIEDIKVFTGKRTFKVRANLS